MANKRTAEKETKKAAKKTNKPAEIKNTVKVEKAETVPTTSAPTTAPKKAAVKIPTVNLKKSKEMVMEHKTQIMWATALVVVLGGLAVLGFYKKDSFIVATVNSKPVTRLEVLKIAEKQSGKAVLDDIITKELIKQEATKNGLTVTTPELDAEIADIEKQLSDSGQNLDEALKSQGMSMADLRENRSIAIILKKLLADKITVTEEEVATYAESIKSFYDKDITPEELKANAEKALKDQKFGQEAQTYIEGLKAGAKVEYWKQY